MDYRDLNVRTVQDYIRERTDLFPPDAQLSVYEYGRNESDGDGYVNHVYRIWDTAGRSVIVKQAKPWLKVFGEGTYPLSTDRNRSETDIVKIRSAIVPDYIPRLLHADAGNHLYVCEDCSHLDIMRFALAQGKRFPRFPEQIGEFMAKCNFYTSEIYLDQKVHKHLACRFTSPEMSIIMETYLFLRESILDKAIDRSVEPHPLHKAASDQFWGKREVRIELMKLRDIYMKKCECLVHGDLHTSNIMINRHQMKVFDMEYTYMGPYSGDSGYLMANLLFAYIAWFYHDAWDEEERAAYREELLNYIRRGMEAYFSTFAQCWWRDAKDIFRPYPELMEGLFETHVREMCGFMGAQMAGRVGDYAELPDFDLLPDEADRNEARALAMTMAYNLIMQRDEMRCVDDILNLARDTAALFHQKRAGACEG